MRLGSVILVVVLALAILPAGAIAQSQKPYMIHGGLGYCAALNEGAPDGSVGLHGGIIYRLEGTPEVGIGGEFGYYMLGSTSYTETDGFNFFEVEAKWTTYPILGELYYFVSPKISTPYLVGGVGVYNLKINVEAATNVATASLSGSDTNFGVNGGLGFLFGSPRSQLRFGADGRFHVIMTEGESTQVIAIMGRIFF